MNIKLSIKSINKTRGVELVDYSISDNILSLQDLLENLVDIEITKYEQKEFKITSQEDLDNMIIAGKISFGFKYREDVINRAHSKDVATLAFSDGLYAVFINDIQLNALDEYLNIKENDILSLIRFTMLTGRFY